jgi:hypothetical protein
VRGLPAAGELHGDRKGERDENQRAEPQGALTHAEKTTQPSALDRAAARG